MTALVGSSGSGKSTIFGLLERFYLPMTGEIFLDGKDISTLNLRWLRRHMSIVSQDPVLFSMTIYESIEHGLVGTKHENVSLFLNIFEEQVVVFVLEYDLLMGI